MLEYRFDEGSLPPEEPIALGREQAGDVRVATWNVLQDGPWQAQKGPRFDRILSAVVPDILNFQEIYDHTPQETAALVESWLPSGQGQFWYSSGNQDCKTISRFPVIQTWALDGNLGVLLDTSDRLGRNLLIVNAHLPCCSNNTQRQAEIDRILSFLKDARTPGGVVDLPEGTPFYVTGDLNLVTLARHLNSLISGDIQNEGTYGGDFDPDWDGTDLTDLLSRQTSKRMVYTWRSETSDYWPGHLDFVIYTDSVLDARNHFVIYTPEMPADSLARHGIQSNDSSASDHLVVCADFRASGPTDTTDQTPGGGTGIRVGPNPWKGRGAVTVDEPGVDAVRLRVLDVQGRHVGYPAGEDWIPAGGGRALVEWSLEGGSGALDALPAGVYFLEVEMRSGDRVRVERIKTIRVP
jgi:endonuclease/exonuclease/phosphatase family metal-dependent hydrolase